MVRVDKQDETLVCKFQKGLKSYYFNIFLFQVLKILYLIHLGFSSCLLLAGENKFIF